MIKSKTKVIDKYPYGGSWHQERDYGYLKVCGTITGCGLAQMRGVVFEDEESLKKKLVKIKQDYFKDGAGGIICTLGSTYYKGHEEKLINCGFEKLSEYTNHRHANGDTQRLYILRY
jgi:hypothetical protein